MIRILAAWLVVAAAAAPARADTDHAIADTRLCLAGGWAPITHHWRVQYGLDEHHDAAERAAKRHGGFARWFSE